MIKTSLVLRTAPSLYLG